MRIPQSFASVPPPDLRCMILANVSKQGEDVIEKDFADQNIFTDISIKQWCMRYQLECVEDYFEAECRNSTKSYAFYTFKAIPDSDL